MPAEMWKDVFQPLSRCHLDACGIVGRSWRRLASGPAAPARHFEHVAFLPPGLSYREHVLISTTFLASRLERWREADSIVTDDSPFTDTPLTFDFNSTEI